MLEIKVTVVIPGMPEAINNLAQALTNSSVPAHPRTVQNISIETIPKTVAEQPVVVPQTNTEITPEPITAESIPVVQTTPIAPTPTPAPAPATNAKKYTREEIAKAGSALVTQNKMPELLALLQKHGVASVAQLKPEQYDAFAADLIALGAAL
jgi:hypothetical protein